MFIVNIVKQVTRKIIITIIIIIVVIKLINIISSNKIKA